MKQRLSEDTELCFVTGFGMCREKINLDKQIYKIKIQYKAPLAEKLPNGNFPYGKTEIMSDHTQCLVTLTNTGWSFCLQPIQFLELEKKEEEASAATMDILSTLGSKGIENPAIRTAPFFSWLPSEKETRTTEGHLVASRAFLQ